MEKMDEGKGKSKTVLEFKKSWHSKTLAIVLTLQVLVGIYSFSKAYQSTISAIFFVLLVFVWISVLVKSPGFLKVAGYYMMLVGILLGSSLSHLFEFANRGMMQKMIESLIDVSLYGLLGYLLWTREKYSTIKKVEK